MARFDSGRLFGDGVVYGETPDLERINLILDLSNADKLRLQPPREITNSVKAFNQPTTELIDKVKEVNEKEVSVSKLQKLLNDLTKQQDYAEALLDAIAPYTTNLTFAVPISATEVRAALIALEMDPNQVSFQDYVTLLRFQLDAAIQVANEQTSLI